MMVEVLHLVRAGAASRRELLICTAANEKKKDCDRREVAAPRLLFKRVFISNLFFL